MFLVILLFSSLLAYVGNDLPVSDVIVEEIEPGASCLMLKHRQKERQKVIREVRHLMGIEKGTALEQLMEQDDLITNKFFLDPSVWKDEAIEVSFVATMSEELQSEMNKTGIENIFFSLKSKGLTWNSRANNFPDHLNLELVNGGAKLLVSYRIYRSDHCFLEGAQPQFSWLDSQADLSQVFNSHKAKQDLEEILIP